MYNEKLGGPKALESQLAKTKVDLNVGQDDENLYHVVHVVIRIL